jgi:iron complex outermembrane receptor protein
LILITLCFALSTFAQGATSITGTVGDEQGAKVAGAEIRLRSRQGREQLTRSDANGAFAFHDLQAGDYFLEVKARGFSDFTSPLVRLATGKTETLDLRLRVAVINESVVITATGTPQRPVEVAKVISILDAQHIEDGHQLDLGDTLRGVPGLRVQQQGSPGALTTFRLRGQRTSDTALLFDGLRVRDASDINGSALSLFSDLIPLAVDRVEILRGSGSSIYGSNAIGGVINLVTASNDNGTHFLVGAEGGNLATFRERLQASGGTGIVGYNLALNRVDVRHGVDGQDEYGSSAGSGRIQIDASPSLTIVANVYGTIGNARINDSPFALPAAFGSTQSFSRTLITPTRDDATDYWWAPAD